MPNTLKLNLGSAYRKLEGFINIDFRPETEPDLCIDVTQGLPYMDNSVDEIWAFDFLEHIPADKVIAVMEDIYRVLKPGGRFETLTPSTDGRGAFQDPTHRSFWNRNSWFYYSIPEYKKLYGIKANFEIISSEEVRVDRWKIIQDHVIAIKR